MKQKQTLPLDAKIKLAKQRIKEWYEYWDGQVYISFSGGKDSTVLMHIVKEMYPDVPVVFVDTGLEYPEVRKFAIENADEVLRPKKKFTEILSECGYPIVSKQVAEAIEYGRKNLKEGKETVRLRQLLGLEKLDNGKPSMFNKTKWKYLLYTDFKISNKCCHYMKKAPVAKYSKQTKRMPIVGTMADESAQRTASYAKHGCNAFTGKTPMSKPLSVWKEQDVLQYIVEYQIPYASVYGDIVKNDDGQYYCTQCDRTGCVFCAFGAHLQKEPNRFQRLKETHPKLYNYCIGGGYYDEDGIWKPNKEGLGMGHVLDEIGVKY